MRLSRLAPRSVVVPKGGPDVCHASGVATPMQGSRDRQGESTMPITAELSAAMEWREKVAELRQVAQNIAEPGLQRRLLALADDWDDFADELELAQMRWPRH
jgi:hypothetical protein